MKKEISFPVTYINGNYQVKILADGTKIRISGGDDPLEPVRPETLDINISNYCEHNCPFCYISASEKGKHGNLEMDFFKTIKPYTEIAINFAKHPGLSLFLARMKERRVIVNMTINSLDFRNLETLVFLNEMIRTNKLHGIGISVNNKTDIDGIVKKLDGYKNIVFHTIAGITSIPVLEQIIDKKYNMLILGYKSKGRGVDVTPHLDVLRYKIADLLGKSIISFDNLAIKQLRLKKIVSEDVWERNFMGEEGEFSMYVDTVSGRYFRSSTETIGFPVGNLSTVEMFNRFK